jgi:adenosylcobinamide-phosphate synthase
VLALALLFDAILPEPSNRFHPVAWMGSFIAANRRAVATWPLFTGSKAGQFLCGAGILMTGASAAATAGWGARRLLRIALDGRPPLLSWAAEALLLHLFLSLRGLTNAAEQVQRALEADDLDAARRLLSWHLVSRKTNQLSHSEVAAATIESVAENASDSVVAPLVAYAVAGLPGALVYRFVNTADAMLGYRDAEREWLGKAPARTDDALNWLPARLTALSMAMAAATSGADGANAIRLWRRDRARTASPNAGHPMSAMAGALRVELSKRGHYTLGAGQAAPGAADIGRANRLVRRAALLVTLLLGVWLGLRDRGASSRPTETRPAQDHRACSSKK